ncbi:metal-sensitive transcriptional regulator [Micromonospora globbae]|uniref:metal-sensitive transcriptional regulator n=1 Tax=Micromonospora globbae TaxID=1894969 RepID=UPI00343CB31A
MARDQRAKATDLPPRQDHIGNRLRRAAGQLTGVLAMYKDGRHPIEILDQLAATRAALDAVALLVLDEFAASCAERLAHAQDAELAIADLTDTVRQYVYSR